MSDKPLRLPYLNSRAHNMSNSGPPIGLVAKALDVELEKVTESYERVLTPRDLRVACETIPPARSARSGP